MGLSDDSVQLSHGPGIAGAFAGRKVLVTGASGFIGSTLCSALRKEGAVVHGISRSEKPAGVGCDQWWCCNLIELSDVQRVLNCSKPDYIFHLAGRVFGDRALTLVTSTFSNIVLTTINLLTAATEVGCKRIILTGSLEEANLDLGSVVPSSPYAAAKFTSNIYGRMFHQLYQAPIVVLRLFMVYGPAQRDMSKLIPYVTSSFLRNESPRLTEGRRLVDWIYVDDVVSAYLRAATVPGAEGMTFDVGSGTLVSIRDVVNGLRDLIMPAATPVFGAIPERPFEQEKAASVDNGDRLPGWQPLTGLNEGLKKTVAWYREMILQVYLLLTDELWVACL
jgi:UDP-glucose 4-epimerase